jgi:hypothetical protein
MRIRVVDVLDLLANGLTAQQVLEELPDLEPEDIQACLKYASRKLNHPAQVIWLTCGNTSNAALRGLLKSALPKALELIRKGERLVEISGAS